jgi:flagellar motor switch protein FliN/FliY
MSEDSLKNAILSQQERDTVSEMTTVAMGAAGSTLGILLGQDVDIVPSSVTEYDNLAAMDIPFGEDAKTLVGIQYTKGLFSTSLLILRNADAARMAEAMLGSSEESVGETLNDLQMGAVGELMNQMMNSAATGLASMLRETVEINNPEVLAYSSDAMAQAMPLLLTEPLIFNLMKIKIGQDAPIEMIELRSISDVKAQVEKIMNLANVPPSAEEEAEDEMEELAAAEPGRSSGGKSASSSHGTKNVDPVTVRPVAFSSFDHQPNVYGEENKNLELVMDVTLNLTVELGKTEISIKDVLELTRGSVIELDRVAGEPVDLMANGKLIAKGEVVVIEDNFGLRITSIVSPADRLRGL